MWTVSFSSKKSIQWFVLISSHSCDCELHHINTTVESNAQLKWDEILNRWSAVQSQCSPDFGDRRINEKMRMYQMVLQDSSLHIRHLKQLLYIQSPKAPPGSSIITLNVHLCFITPWPLPCALITSINPFHFHTPLQFHSTQLWKLSTLVASNMQPMLIKPQRVNYLSLYRVPIQSDKNDIIPILPITMALTRTCNQQTSVLC